jgi:hypothetical protein
MVMSKTFSGCGAAAALGVEGGALLAGAPADGGLLAADGAVLGANDGTAEAVARRSLEARRQPAKVTRPATTASGKSNERRVKAAPFTTRLLGVLGERRRLRVRTLPGGPRLPPRAHHSRLHECTHMSARK